MGSTISSVADWISTRKTVKLGNTILDETEDFMITINIYTIQKITDKESELILEYMQYMQPYVSYICNNIIYLIFRPSHKLPFIRSNVLDELISFSSSELSIWMIKNIEKDPRMINVGIYVNKYQTLLNELLETIDVNNCVGKMYGIDNLAKEKINEKFK